MFTAEQFRMKAAESAEFNQKYRRPERNPQIGAIDGKLQSVGPK